VFHCAFRRYTIFSRPPVILTDCRYLAQGDSVRSKSWEFLFGKSTPHKLIPEVCEAIWNALQPTYLPVMDCAKWCKVAEGFQN